MFGSCGREGWGCITAEDLDGDVDTDMGRRLRRRSFRGTPMRQDPRICDDPPPVTSAADVNNDGGDSKVHRNTPSLSKILS